MSIKINISYEEESEIKPILERLSPLFKHWNVKKTEKGKYKHIYLIQKK